MKFGITVDNPGTVIEDARQAEEMGFDFLGCGEHLFFHGPTPNAFAMLAAAAGATTRIRLVSSITLLPLYPAAVVAKMAAVIDTISQGRFALGVGVGGEYPPEFVAAGIDPATRFRRTDEGLEVIRMLFRGDTVTFDGEFNTVPGLALNPPPNQPGGPPIWLGGRKPAALRRAGRHADVWMPYMVDPTQLGRGLQHVRDAATRKGPRRNVGLRGIVRLGLRRRRCTMGPRDRHQRGQRGLPPGLRSARRPLPTHRNTSIRHRAARRICQCRS